ncbi:MAG TPA: methyltransferase domain-containing protein, partial [Firmicutes bacterium]|nr:methyltransferase domain-containing protein [Bacillota bacterium]
LLYLSLPRCCSPVLDIGSGSGILSLLYAKDNPSSCVTGIDIVKKNSDLAICNAKRNGLSGIRFLEGDIKEYADKDPYALIFSNPPYRKAGSGRLSPFPEKNIALYDTHLDFYTLFSAVKRLLSPQGLFFMIIWEGRRDEMLERAAGFSLFPFREIIYRGVGKNHHSFVVSGFSPEKKAFQRDVIEHKEWSEAVRALIQAEVVMKGDNL